METAEPFADVFIGRQPIFDRGQGTIGYELLFRDSTRNAADISDHRAATADVVCKAFAEFGFTEALGAQRAFVNVAADLLFGDAVRFLPRQMVVLDLQLDEAAMSSAAPRCLELQAQGYELCVTATAGNVAAIHALLDAAAYVRINVNDAATEDVGRLVTRLRSARHKLIAGRVESRAQWEACRQLGFDLFQGHYFAEAEVIGGRKLSPATRSLMRLIDLLDKDAEIGALESAFKGEPALTINLLRLTNSVGAGVPVRIGSVRHAITVLGRQQLQRWLQLLLFARPGESGGIAGNPLMQWAALRGHFMELLATRGYPAKKDLHDKAFIAGLMSLMPSALGVPITEIADQLVLAREVRQALVERSGDIGRLLQLAERYDENDIDGTTALLRHFGGRLNLQSLAVALADALAWVRGLCADAD